MTFVLETAAHAERRGAKVLGRVTGYAYGNNGQHPTHIDAAAVRVTDLLKNLLARSGTDITDIGFVVGHGNGMPISDAAEIACMRKIFSAHTKPVPLISTKPIYGHTMGAASALNVAAAVLILAHGRTIPTANMDYASASSDMSFGSDAPLPGGKKAGIALSCGIGGHNSAITLEEYRRPP